MLKHSENALKIKDIRQKLIFTFFMLVVIRFGSAAADSWGKDGLISRMVLRISPVMH